MSKPLLNLTATPVVSTATTTYATGESIGGLIAFGYDSVKSHRTGKICWAAVRDKSDNNANVDILFFNDNPVSSTVSDTGAVSVVDADLPKLIGAFSLTKHVDVGPGNISMPAVNDTREIPFTVQNSDLKTFYAAVVARAAFVASTASTVHVTVSVEMG